MWALNFHDVLASAAKTLLKATHLIQDCLQILYKEMGSTHTKLLLHIEVHWLSQGWALNRLYKLREEVFTFLNKKLVLTDNFKDQQWLANVAGIFQLINKLNHSLQGPSKTIFDLRNSIDTCKKNLKLWGRETH